MQNDIPDDVRRAKSAHKWRVLRYRSPRRKTVPSLGEVPGTPAPLSGAALDALAAYKALGASRAALAIARQYALAHPEMDTTSLLRKFMGG